MTNIILVIGTGMTSSVAAELAHCEEVLAMEVAMYEVHKDLGVDHITKPNFAVYCEVMADHIAELRDIVAEEVEDDGMGMLEALLSDVLNGGDEEFECGQCSECCGVPQAEGLDRLNMGILGLDVDTLPSATMAEAFYQAAEVDPLDALIESMVEEIMSDLGYPEDDGKETLSEFLDTIESEDGVGVTLSITTEGESEEDVMDEVDAMLERFPYATVVVDDAKVFHLGAEEENEMTPTPSEDEFLDQYLEEVTGFAERISQDDDIADATLEYNAPEGVDEVTGMEAIHILIEANPGMSVEWPGVGNFSKDVTVWYA